jgi:ArsR family transcriptional regulator
VTVVETGHVADFMKAFSNPVRLKLLLTIDEHSELSVNELVEKTGEKQCYVSQQLKLLADKGILERRKDRHNVYYSLKNKHVVDMLTMVEIEMQSGKPGMELVAAK